MDMEKNCTNLFQDLDFCQHKITLLFKDIWNEWLGYEAVVKAMKNKFSNLLDECSALKIENNKLKENCGRSKSLIMKCLDFIHKFDDCKQSLPETFGMDSGILKQHLLDAIHSDKNIMLSSHNESDLGHLKKKNQYDFKKKTYTNEVDMFEIKNESMFSEKKNGLKEINFSNINNKESFVTSDTLVSSLKRKSDEFNKHSKNDSNRLNINAFKIKKLNNDESSANDTTIYLNKTLPKFSVDTEEDDFISESPKFVPSLDDLVSNKKENDLNQNQMRKSGNSKNLINLDETYMPSIIVEKYKSSDEENDKADDPTPCTLEEIRCSKSPEFDSVPLMYNRQSKINEKSKKLKSPVRLCSDCNKYFEAGFGKRMDDGENLNKIFNKCSRHQQKRFDDKIEDTPPGYWKPYLTHIDSDDD